MSGANLRKAMGFFDLTLFYVVAVLSLRWIATAAAAGPSAIIIWIAGCIAYFVPLTFCLLELSSRYPEEGGMYLWSKKAFGEFAGFMTGWMYWVAVLPYYPALLYFGAGNALFIGGDRWQHLSTSQTYFIVVALAGLTLSFVLNVIGLDTGKWLHNLGAVGTWLPATGLIVMGLAAWTRFGSATTFSSSTMIPSLDFKNVFFWSTVAFAFGGMETASAMGDEIENPRRNIPRALFGAGALVTVIYIAGTFAVLTALPAGDVSGLQGFMQAMTKVAGKVGMEPIAPFAAVLVTVSSIGTVSAYFASTARLPFVAGLDHFLPKAFGRVHPKWRTPYVALAVQAVFAATFVVLGQAGESVKRGYEFLVGMGVMAYFLPLIYLFAAMIRLQWEPAGPEVIRVPGGKPIAIFMAVLGLFTTLLSTVFACIPPGDEPNKASFVVKLIGFNLLLVVVGVGIYWLGKRSAAKSA